VIGENGLGKTVVLEAVSAFFSENYQYFQGIDFHQFILNFDDQIWEITKTQTSEQLSIYVTRYVEGQKNTRTRPEKIAEIDISEKGSSKVWLKHIEGMQVLGRHEGDGVDLERRLLDLKRAEMHRFIYEHEFLNRKTKFRDAPPWFRSAREKVSIRLIETQRIITAKERGGEAYISRVEKSAKELSEVIADIDKVASQISIELDGTFPNRLVGMLRKGQVDSLAELNSALSELDDRRKRLSSLGLLETAGDTDILGIDEGPADLSSALKLYIDDSHKKLAPYDSISSKLELFKGVVNKRFKHKELEVDRKSGFKFRSTVKRNAAGKFEEIPKLKLSSGEQNELILFYELIFKSAKNDVIFIDEPELSLHISWQNKFIDDLKEITSINKVSIVIATHSPDIIGENWDLKVELKGVE